MRRFMTRPYIQAGILDDALSNSPPSLSEHRLMQWVTGVCKSRGTSEITIVVE